MTKNNYTPLSDDTSQPLAMGVAGDIPLEHPGTGGAATPPFVQWSQPQGPGFAVYLHALRRHWVLATGLGLLVAVLVGPTAWFTYGPEYTANSFLRIAAEEQTLVFQTAENTTRTAFDIYKGTQQQLVKSRFVLTAALRRPEVARLECVKRQDDPIVWLAEELSVRFPGDAEIMDISLAGDDPREVATLVRAVVNAYVEEVVNVERNQRRRRLDELDRVYADKETEVRTRRTEFKQLAEQLGTGDTVALSLKQQNALQELASYRIELMQVQFRLLRAKGELKAAQALLDGVDDYEISEIELDSFAQADPVARQLQTELFFRRSDAEYTAAATVHGTKSPYIERYQRDIKMVEDQYDSLGEELREKIQRKKQLDLQNSLRELQIQIDVLTAQEEQLKNNVEQKREEAEQFGGSSIDVEMMRTEIEHLNQVLNGIANERERLKVELRSASRITLIQLAEPPETADQTGRFALAVLAALMGLVLPGCCIALWDTRAQRINSATEVSRSLGLPVIGAVPVIPAQAIRQLGSPSGRHMNWHTRLTESADSIAARLLRKAQLEQVRVVLITSAMGGEGKTTLATQVAMSLARSQHKTVLVDFDLRRPAFDEIFGLPLKPGVSEFLRGESDVAKVVQQTATNDLSVVTAGRWDRQALTALANGVAGSLFEKLREEYEFVLVDASPILPVADTRFVSQHVDAVVFSILRDVSQAPRISAACEILRGFGVRVMEAVVTGPSEGGRYKDLGYEPRLPA